MASVRWRQQTAHLRTDVGDNIFSARGGASGEGEVTKPTSVRDEEKSIANCLQLHWAFTSATGRQELLRVGVQGEIQEPKCAVLQKATEIASKSDEKLDALSSR